VVNPPRAFLENLDELPFPARHLLPSMEHYSMSYDWEGRKPDATIFSSRGCPFNCIYCASKVMWKRRVRFRSAQNVLAEVDHLVKDCGVREILFYDDHFTLNKERLYAICRGLIERKYDLTWCCLSRVDSIDIETARLMKKSGCHMMSFGVESGSQMVLDAMNKGVKVQQIVDAFRTCRRAGINTKASFIFGGPKETKETVMETRRLIRQILPDYVWFFIMTPMPGTELYRLHQESGMACDEWSMYDQTTYTKFYGTKLTYEELRKAVFESYKGYYLSAPYVFSTLSKLSTRKVRVAMRLAKNVPVALNYMRRGRGK
jgi:anaerobic magnesium-protoporphyrin IX monomethyl ester cyclase